MQRRYFSKELDIRVISLTVVSALGPLNISEISLMGLFLAAKHAQTRQVCLVFVCKLYASLRFGGVKKEEAVIQPSSKYL